MVQEYLYEIIAFIAILTAITIYILTIRFKIKDANTNNTIHNAQNKKTLQNIKLKEDVEKASVENDSYIESAIEEEIFSNEADTTSSYTIQTPKREKIEVPVHGKIKKDNFKEFDGIKILVAEDNIINQKVITGLLAGSGIEVTMANDGQVALDILQRNSDFNLILMDANMPRVDGFQATRIIRSNPEYEHIVVVALSGDIATDDIRKMRSAGMEEHLEKPLRMDAFYDILYAYTKGVTQAHDFVEVIMTKELNGDKGLHVCGGDDKFYKDILQEFIINYTNSAENISTLLNQGDIQLADNLLLDFIGITANIGAEHIRDIALELKEAIKDTEEKSYTIILEEYKLYLEVLIQDIKEYLQ